MTEGYFRQLVNYLKKNLAKGYTIESLKWALISQGYSRTEVARAIKVTNDELAKKAPKIKEKPVIKVERVPFQEIDTYQKPKGFSNKFKNFLRSLREFFES